jgi:heme oxygenase
MSASTGSLYERLRAATQPLHGELEEAVDIAERLKSREGYARHLVGLYRAHAAIEAALQALDFSPFGFVYPCPYRSALLEDDLVVLGYPADALRRVEPPQPPQLKTIPAGLGCLYVVEGSAKGARAILPAISSSLGLDAKRGASFFYGFGRETGKLWRGCMSAIDTIDARSPQADCAVDAAIDTFNMFREVLVRPQGRDAPASLETAAKADRRAPAATHSVES